MKKFIKIFVLFIIFVISLGCLSMGPVYSLKINQKEIIIEAEEEGADPTIEYQDIYLGEEVSNFIKLDGIRNKLSFELFTSLAALLGGLLIGGEFSYLLFGGRKGKRKDIHPIRKPDTGLKEKVPQPIEQKELKF